jgi:5'-methylthioadenosine phosphorylase
VVELARSFSERPAPCPEGCDRTLDSAIITPAEARDPEVMRRLDAVAGRILDTATPR